MGAQSTAFDPVIGAHFHLVVYPPPAPPGPGLVLGVGMVTPNLVGMVIDFVCELIGLAPSDTRVLVHGCEATTTGSEAMQLHLPLGGLMIAPPDSLLGDGKFWFGSRDVLIGEDA